METLAFKGEEAPLRKELLSIEQLERHAKAIATSHKLAPGRGQELLLRRLDDNQRVLLSTYDLVTAAAGLNRRIEPAAEWLLDNFYLVEDQIRAIRRLLPPSFSRELPKLANGPSAGLPRVYDIALEIISHVDGRFDEACLNSFMIAYQSVEPLKLGELWALALMLRLALIENLRRVAVRIASARRDRDSADAWAKKMVSAVEEKPTDLILVLADMARANPPLTGAFMSELTRHLQGQNPNFSFTHSWIENRLADDGFTTEQLVLEEGQAQAADQVSIGNSINSLRFLNSNDWRDFVSLHSLVEQTLATDPAKVYAHMDFATRDRYRHAVEGIARRSRYSEFGIARKAIQLSEIQAREHPHAPSAHVGFYLIDAGRLELERAAEMRYVPSVVLEKLRRKVPLTLYLFCFSLVTLLSSYFFFRGVFDHQSAHFIHYLFILPALVAASSLGLGLTNWFATQVLSPQSLPRLDFSKGIPPDNKTLVAVPTMLTSLQGIEDLLEGLELRYLGNRDPSLHFALVTDFVDSTTQHRTEDDELVRQAKEGIDRLNTKYSNVRLNIFFLLHRDRSWNSPERIWMGYERKRGKLADLNAMLRGAQGRFSIVAGDTSVLEGIRFVITLDTDTQLPSESASQMVGTLAHPLNRPIRDTKTGRVTSGYTILQPRVGVGMLNAQRSRFSSLYSEDPGVDPYTRVVSDVYQDLFGEGSFVGKGIYDVDAFERCCSDFPENTILSHDLIEGAYCRSGLLSDVTLYEEYPSRYAADIGRRHRWIRGDWQIAGWLLPWVRDRTRLRKRSPISFLSQWKIFDNLRRSVVPLGMLTVLIGSWLYSTHAALASLVFLASIVYLPVLFSSISSLLRKPADLPWNLYLREVLESLTRPIGQGALTLLFLPYEAYVNGDAIFRTLFRIWWSKRRMLEWKTAMDSDRSGGDSLLASYRVMFVAPLLAISIAMLLVGVQPSMLPWAMPWLLSWTLSPFFAWWLSQPIRVPLAHLSEQQHHFLETLSRKTWRYFEEYVAAENHYLPPDNIQQNPEVEIAHRTSPTNIGMGVIAELTAYDFGYSSSGLFLERIQNTFETLSGLERHRGHFFNWYDTHSLQPMYPLYVSTVDSGNLAANLLVFASGCEELASAPLIPERMFGGLRDTLRVVLEVARTTEPPVVSSVLRKLESQIEDLQALPSCLGRANELLSRMRDMTADLIASNRGILEGELGWWVRALDRSVADHQGDLHHLATWLQAIPFPASPMLPGAAEDPLVSELRIEYERLDHGSTIHEIAESWTTLSPKIDLALPSSTGEIHDWLLRWQADLYLSSQRASGRVQAWHAVAQQSRELAVMDFDFLFVPSRDLFAIGFNFSERRLDASFYDLLASEARLASYLVIAQGHRSQSHWFSLGRMLTSAGSVPSLLSWSGSMFEYLMPLLIMPNFENTLLDRTYQAVVRRQISYGRQRGVPWGISESGFNTIDQHHTYQYRAFGVPGLGLKRGLAEDLVIAPYASAMALMVMPESSCRNLERLSLEGHMGPCGLYEAIDYTPSRLPPGATSVTVRQFMAHHQGMTLLSLAYVLLDRPMQRRFLADPVLRSAILLLQERVPKATAPVYPHASEANATQLATPEETGTMRIFTDPNSPGIEVHLLSNGRYHVFVTSAGGGASRWRDLAVTRWREDATRDNYGNFCYLRDLGSGAVWSNTWQPTASRTSKYEAIFSQARAEFRRVDNQIETYTQISVSPEDDIELRRITLTNRSEFARTIEVTSYAEVVLATQAQDEAHPAFSNLFVQTELIRNRQAIFCTRRPRSSDETPPWMTHMLVVRGTVVGAASYETDRMKFIGRDRCLSSPAALEGKLPLSDSQGSVLDPIVSIRQSVLLQAHESVRVDIVTGVAESRAAVVALTEKYHDASLADRVFDLAWTHGHILLQQLSASEADAQIYGRLAGSILYTSGLRRAAPSILARNRRGQSGLWGYGISGDVPIMLVRIRNSERLQLVHQVLQAHAYWRLKGLVVDLVIWNEDDSVYRQTLQEAIVDLVAASPEAALVDRPGGVFIRRGEQMTEEDRALLQAVAKIVILDDGETLADQAERRIRNEVWIPSLKPKMNAPQTIAEVPHRDLAYFNGLGGFSQDGREYVTILSPGKTTPAPWSNVLANPQFGTVVSESGSAYTWAENCHEYRLTPWQNDPVSDLNGEAIYLRDEESGRFWSPTPLPARGQNTYIVRHGFGYSIFDYTEDGLTTELCVFVATDASVKFCKLKITNHSGRSRQLSVTSYWELVLGDVRNKSVAHVVTESDSSSGALFARNYYSPDFGDRVAFFNCSESSRSFTGDRTEFLGRNGNPANPSAMKRVRLSGRVGAGYDPCVAFQTPLTIHDGQERTITFTIGAAQNVATAKTLAQRFRSVDSADRAIEKVWHYWSRTLGVVYLETPDASLNFLANGWLTYQTLCCRMWARSGFYQSGGAFGFRDQLQDAMAIAYSEPQLLRDQVQLAAAHQFREGDAQHWWHPPVGRGVRTHFSDDFLWLPLALCRYVSITGDTGVLDEPIPFLTSRPLREDEESHYDLPNISKDIGTLYEHGYRAIDRALRFGEHGLPLMGCGDWNDGMNLVGQKGRGESVWLAFFLFHVLNEFSKLAINRGDISLADRYAIEAGRLRGNIETHGWDGEWYRRAYFDDGTPLGSSNNEECQIDSIAQSWSVLSGGGTRERCEVAMKSLYERLVRPKDRIVLLLDPPFDKSTLNPGYIKGYVPGVRENGGQYTHAAIWAAMAAAATGDSGKAWEIFSLINPISHGSNPESIQRYRVEPYVVAADVYGVAPHVGRGGWTWYTGSAGWMYRLIVESIVGLKLEVDKLRITPCTPEHWTEFQVHYRFRETFYHLKIRNRGRGIARTRFVVNGEELSTDYLPLIDDRQDHRVDVEFYSAETLPLPNALGK